MHTLAMKKQLTRTMKYRPRHATSLWNTAFYRATREQVHFAAKINVGEITATPLLCTSSEEFGPRLLLLIGRLDC